MERDSCARFSAAADLWFLALVHANWARGSPWPAKSRAELSQAVIGAQRLPGALPTLTVAALLALAALLVADAPVIGPRLRSTGRATVAIVLGLRAVAGFTGLMPQKRRSQTFRRWDRRLYSRSASC